MPGAVTIGKIFITRAQWESSNGPQYVHGQMDGCMEFHHQHPFFFHFIRIQQLLIFFDVFYAAYRCFIKFDEGLHPLVMPVWFRGVRRTLDPRCKWVMLGPLRDYVLCLATRKSGGGCLVCVAKWLTLAKWMQTLVMLLAWIEYHLLWL